MELENIAFEPAVEWGIEPHPWHGFGFLDKLLTLALPVLSLGVLILPFLDQAFLRRLARLPGFGGLTDWLVNSGGSWLLGLGLLILWVGFLLFKRWRIAADEHQWVDAGCPQCLERDLVRVSRERRDRWYGLLGIPAFRYACRNCTWRGLRIARRHRHLVLAQEQIIAASSATLEPAGVRVSDTALVDTMDFEDLAPEQPSILADVVKVEDVDFSPDLNALAEVEEVAAEVSVVTEAPVESVDDDATTADESISEKGEADDDLDWLWRKLSDEA
jgi:hypothetical protein